MSTGDSVRYPTETEQTIGKLLAEGGFFTRDNLEESLKEAEINKKPLREVLIGKELIARESYVTFLSMQTRVPIIDLPQVTIQKEAIALVPEEIARRYNVLPISLEGDDLRVAMDDPQDMEAINTLATITGRVIRPRIPLRGGILVYLNEHYRLTPRTSSDLRDLLEGGGTSLRRADPNLLIPEDVMSELEKSHELDPETARGMPSYEEAVGLMLDKYLTILMNPDGFGLDARFVMPYVDSDAEGTTGVTKDLYRSVANRLREATTPQQTRQSIVEGIRRYKP